MKIVIYTNSLNINSSTNGIQLGGQSLQRNIGSKSTIKTPEQGGKRA